MLNLRTTALGGGGLVALGAMALACAGSNGAAFTAGLGDAGSAANDGASPPLSDASSPADAAANPDGGLNPPSDAGGAADAPAVSDASGPPVEVTLLAVHASPNLPNFRLCFGLSSGGDPATVLATPPYPNDPAHPMPLTNLPGVAAGGAALLPPILVRPGAQVTPYVIGTNVLPTQGFDAPGELTCDHLVCSTANGSCVPHYELPSFAFGPPGPLVVAVTGCAPASAALGIPAGSIAECGAGYDPLAGNLATVVTPVLYSGAAGWGVQTALLSPSLQDLAADGGVSLTYVDPSADASVPLPFGADMDLPFSDASVTSAALVVGGPAGPLLTESLLAVQYFEAPAADSFTFFASKTTYFVAVVGDRTDAAAPASSVDGAASSTFDGHGLHVVAYATGP